MVLENKEYVPTLAVRASEMNGLEFLPGATKDRMTPCFLLAPWASSNSLDRTIGRIESAYPNRSYFLDIDRYYEFTNTDSIPQRELAELMDPDRSYGRWVDFVSSHDRIWPCIQTGDLSQDEIQTQIESFQALGRTYCMRIVLERFPDNFDAIVGAFAAGGTADFAIILEGGWTEDPLSLAARFSGLLAQSLEVIDARVPVVLSCTSMPKIFTDFSSDEPETVEFTNRELLRQVAAGSNRAHVIYGDWGSTRPRESGGFANRPLDRIDYPTSQAWHIARNKEEDWDFNDAANAVVDSDAWDGGLGIWGEEMIRQTAINQDIGINTPQKNVASRVNIHLHLQAFYGQARVDPITFDEDWED